MAQKAFLKKIWAAICLDGPKMSFVFLKVKFKRFVQGSQKFRIYPNSIKQKYDFNSCFLYSKKAKYLNSDLRKRNYDVLKIPRKASLKKMGGYPSFEMSFFQKSDVIWSLGHYPCSVLGLVYRNQRKTFLGTVDFEAQEFDKVG